MPGTVLGAGTVYSNDQNQGGSQTRGAYRPFAYKVTHKMSK